MADNNSGGGFVLGLFVGGVIGAMIGLLMAPKTGAQTRADIWDLGDTWRSRADEMAADMRARGMPDLGNVTGRVGPAVDSLRQRGSSTTDAVRDAETGAVRSRMGVGDGREPTVGAADAGGDSAASEGAGTTTA